MSRKRADQVGIIASSLCGLHCLGAALLIGTSGALAVFADERVELALVGIAVVIAAFALVTGYRRHRHTTPSVLAAVAVIAFVVARTILHDHEAAELTASLVAAASLVGAHVSNLRAHRTCCA